MPTSTNENYLKAMFSLEARGADITLTALSKSLEVSSPTVNAMVKKMQEKGWLTYAKYQPIKLSESGRLKAAEIVRKHRLSEMYMEQVMGFGWEEVHDIAEELEHISSQKFFDRMDEILGFPTHDPHGSPIPDKDGKIQTKPYVVLSDLAKNKSGVLRGLRNSSNAFLEYLNSKEIQLGTFICVEDIEAFDQSMKISYTDANSMKKSVVISQEVSSRLLIDLQTKE